VKSVMVQRIGSDNQAFRMPPAYLGYAKLPEREIDLIRRWIAEGAKWQKHCPTSSLLCGRAFPTIGSDWRSGS
jgi:hypothetical protein